MMRRWRRSIAATLAISMVCASLTACGGNDEDVNKNEESVAGVNYDIYNSLEEGYQFDLASVEEKQQSGNMSGTIYIDRAFLMELSGWEYVTEAYSALYPEVEFKLNEYASGTDMATAIKTPMLSGTTTVGLVQGNYVKTELETTGYNFQAGILDEVNEYAGAGEDGEGIIWSDIMSSQLLDNSNGNYLLVSQETETGIFVNTTALVEAGVVDKEGNAKIPTTWNEMMDACEALKAAGYTAPFGIGQTTGTLMDWMIKIYGDQYYRDLLDDVQQMPGDFNYKQAAGGFELDLLDGDITLDDKYNVNQMRLFNSLLNTSSDSPYYVGANSEKFRCLMRNFLKMGNYVSATFTEDSMDKVQQDFLAGTKDSPVFMPNYVGFGISIMNTEGVNFEWDVMDYVPMECNCDVKCNEGSGCDHVDNNATHNECTKHCVTTLTRDVGGSGGYIGLYTYGKSEELVDLYLDFIKFYLSPYGQSCFYYGLAEGGGSPKAMSGIVGTVSPSDWNQFFEAIENVEFNGLAALNPYVSYIAFGPVGYDSQTALKTVMGNSLRKGEAGLEDVCSAWDSSLSTTYEQYFMTTYGKGAPYMNYTVNPNN